MSRRARYSALAAGAAALALSLTAANVSAADPDCVAEIRNGTFGVIYQQLASGQCRETYPTLTRADYVDARDFSNPATVTLYSGSGCSGTAVKTVTGTERFSPVDLRSFHVVRCPFT
ncbi:hypothetical protein [Streptomyces sp. NPDC046261]|uniref:hypothetical protein n=1 Tax=Streptomyces sp. NPDC046261 TaxID=3157200 RepID=UPI0033E0A8C9